MIRSLLLSLLFISTAHAIPGMDFLGGARYCDTILKNHPQGWAAGFFVEVDGFGDSTSCIRALLRSGKTDTIRAHLEWSDTHSFPKSRFDAIAGKASRLESIAREFPNAKIYVSGACEHNLNSTDAKLLRAKVLAKCPSCTAYVNTPWKGAKIDGINEFHNKDKGSGRFIHSFDGTPVVDADSKGVINANSGALIQFLWDARFNGRWEDNDNTPRAKRRGWPDGKLIQSVQYLWTDKGRIGKLPANWIYKSHSENKGNGDSRAEKPVVIITPKTSSISFVATNGREIGKASYYGTFEGGRHRYYASIWGYELAEKARAVSGSPLVTIRVGGKSYGPINPAFRAGSFR